MGPRGDCCLGWLPGAHPEATMPHGAGRVHTTACVCGVGSRVALHVLSPLQMKEALMEIIQLATLDSDPWVLMVADILKSFPDTGSLNLDLEEQNPNVQDILGELREKGMKCGLSVLGGEQCALQGLDHQAAVCGLCCGSQDTACVRLMPTCCCLALCQSLWQLTTACRPRHWALAV